MWVPETFAVTAVIRIIIVYPMQIGNGIAELLAWPFSLLCERVRMLCLICIYSDVMLGTCWDS